MQPHIHEERTHLPAATPDRLSPLLTFDGHDQRSFAAVYEDANSDPLEHALLSPDTDMGVSRLAASGPSRAPFLVASSSVSSPVDESFETDLSSSPAAMFLSAFSPAASERSLAPDDEFSVVAGYTLGPIVGHGGFSIIRTASSTQGGTVAVKIVRRSDLDKQPDPTLARKNLDREAEVWASLGHEHILPLFTVTHSPYADFFFTAYCPAGSLFDILKRDGRPALPQDDAGMMFRQVVRGLRYMHEVAGFVHGDLKLENVLVDEMGVCKIGDFGMSRKIGEVLEDREEELDHEREMKHNLPHRSRTISQAHPLPAQRSVSSQTGKPPHHLPLMRRHGLPMRHRTSSPYPVSGTSSTVPNRGYAPGSLPYAAPELLLAPSNTTPYVADPAQDNWALGVMLYTLLTGKLPFNDAFEPRLQMKILHGVFDMPQDIGRSAEQTLRGCLERSVPNRWTAAMVDEVAWGIGWGSAADDVTPPPEPTASRRASRSASRSRVQTRNNSSADAREERSTSRAARSSDRSSSAIRSASRSQSRSAHHPYDQAFQHHHHHHHHPLLHTTARAAVPIPSQPSLSALTNAILRTNSDASSDSSASHDCALVLQSTAIGDIDVAMEQASLTRGRVPRPRLPSDASVSRSRSPHEMPVTPRDVSLNIPLRRRKSPPARPSLSTPELDQASELDTLDEDGGWELLSPSADTDSVAARSLSRLRDADDASSARSSPSRGRAFPRSRDELRKVLRNGSMPPALSPERASAWQLTPAARGSASGCATGVAAPATPMTIPGVGQATRSRSLGPEGPREGRFRPLFSVSRRAK